jgi:hypothetical protein
MMANRFSASCETTKVMASLAVNDLVLLEDRLSQKARRLIPTSRTGEHHVPADFEIGGGTPNKYISGISRPFIAVILNSNIIITT